MSSRRVNLKEKFHPRYVVWELTLQCDQQCHHCGSRAVRPRSRELNKEEALQLASDLVEMGTKDVVLIGGEAYLFRGYADIIRKLSENGVTVGMTTGGFGVDEKVAGILKESGIAQVSVSIDGLENSHNTLRGNDRSFNRAIRAVQLLHERGISVAANTNVNRMNFRELDALYRTLKEIGISAWQVQLTVPLGRAADHPEFVIEPFHLLEIMPNLTAIKKRAYADNILLLLGNNMGYFGRGEAFLRSSTEESSDHWSGCLAGKYIMGIESNGDIKGCPSLQSDTYVGGNIFELSLREIWDNSPALSFTRKRKKSDLWGFCAECAFAKECLGGCTFSAHSFFGKPGNNPFCHYRVTHFARSGKKEILSQKTKAPGLPFDNGLFETRLVDLQAEELSIAKAMG